MRIKQDAIPGMTIPFFFTPIMTSAEFLKKITGSKRDGKGYEIACAQLCGSGHSEMMKGDLFVLDSKEYQQWYFGRIWEQKNYVEPEDGDGWNDEWF